MQHTETYNLNLIETSDTFSPDPLNQNAQALEDALSDETDAREAGVADLDARLKVFEAKHVKVGMYKPLSSSVPLTIYLGFTPKVVLALSPKGERFGSLYEGYSISATPPSEIVPGGFRINTVTPNGLSAGADFVYLAFD